MTVCGEVVVVVEVVGDELVSGVGGDETGKMAEVE